MRRALLFRVVAGGLVAVSGLAACTVGSERSSVRTLVPGFVTLSRSHQPRGHIFGAVPL